MAYYDRDAEGCTCFRNAPCGYCTSHGRCDHCDAFEWEDLLHHIGGVWLCAECLGDYQPPRIDYSVFPESLRACFPDVEWDCAQTQETLCDPLQNSS